MPKVKKMNDLYWFDLNRGEQFNGGSGNSTIWICFLKKTFDGQVDIQSKNSKPLILKRGFKRFE